MRSCIGRSIFLLVLFATGCLQPAPTAPAPAGLAEIPRDLGEHLDRLAGSWKVTGLVDQNGYTIGHGGTDVVPFLRIATIEIDHQSMTLMYLDEEQKIRMEYVVESKQYPCKIRLHSDVEGERGDLGAICAGSDKRLILCFGLPKVPVGGPVTYPDRFASTDNSVCLELVRK